MALPDIDQKIIVIFGPTMTKKTGLAVNLAKYLWGKYQITPVLISADSDLKDLARRQVGWIPKISEKVFVKSWEEARRYADAFLLGAVR